MSSYVAYSPVPADQPGDEHLGHVGGARSGAADFADPAQHGATVCATSQDALRSDLAQAVCDLRCTHVDLTPTVNQLLLDSFDPIEPGQSVEAWRRASQCPIVQLATGSEPVPRELVGEWVRRGVTVVNVRSQTNQQS